MFMDKDFLKGIKGGFGFILIIALVTSVFAIGFHYAGEIFPGVFQGDFTFNGSIDMSGHRIGGIAAPVGPNDVPNKAYVDALASGATLETLWIEDGGPVYYDGTTYRTRPWVDYTEDVRIYRYIGSSNIYATCPTGWTQEGTYQLASPTSTTYNTIPPCTWVTPCVITTGSYNHWTACYNSSATWIPTSRTSPTYY